MTLCTIWLNHFYVTSHKAFHRTFKLIYSKVAPTCHRINPIAMKSATFTRTLLALTASIFATFAQPAAAPAKPPQAPLVTSPEVNPDRSITFRIFAPNADAVKLSGGDIPGNGQGKPMVKSENGVWQVTVDPVVPGAYRYNFNVGGLTVIDPRNPATSESVTNTWSLVSVPGSDFMDTRDVPHGAVAAVTYHSTVLNRFRRMTVYTPPGYEMSTAKLPVFYLLHGSGDSDASWASVGRAGFIMDNLIASKKAKPMIVVMPAGHTSAIRAPGPDAFLQEFTDDVMPYVEKHYRALTDRSHRAIAGLSMGGGQTLNIAIPHLNQFAYVGVYSAGLFNAFPNPRPGAPVPPPAASGPSWEEQHAAELDNAATKKGLKLFWFATGKEDRLFETTQKTVALLQKHGFSPVFSETAGGHTWLNWRDYLNEFVPKLF